MSSRLLPDTHIALRAVVGSTRLKGQAKPDGRSSQLTKST